MQDVNDLIQAYTKDPVGNVKPKDFSCSYILGNAVCGDDIEVFLSIDRDGYIYDFGYLGSPSMFTITAASLLAEHIYEQKKISYTILMEWNFDTIKNLGFDVSTRRQMSAVAPLLACRNALHLWLDDGIIETFDTML